MLFHLLYRFSPAIRTGFGCSAEHRWIIRLTRRGFRTAVMKADAMAPDPREAWVAEKVKRDVNVLIFYPRLVQTGWDLINFPTIYWYEIDYSVYVMRQASWQSWRIGQTRPVEVAATSSAATFPQTHVCSPFALQVELLLCASALIHACEIFLLPAAAK